jgi:hypothetical protein
MPRTEETAAGAGNPSYTHSNPTVEHPAHSCILPTTDPLTRSQRAAGRHSTLNRRRSAIFATAAQGYGFTGWYLHELAKILAIWTCVADLQTPSPGVTTAVCAVSQRLAAKPGFAWT